MDAASNSATRPLGEPHSLGKCGTRTSVQVVGQALKPSIEMNTGREKREESLKSVGRTQYAPGATLDRLPSQRIYMLTFPHRGRHSPP